jgi:thiosulfate reductase cytochrome b subunit
MKSATRRSILRWIHIIVTIPIFGYIYGPAAEVEQYAGAVRFVFVPVIVISGLWMYAGIYFAVFGVVLLLGAYQLSGSGAAVLTTVGLFIARAIWLAVRAPRETQTGDIKA